MNKILLVGELNPYGADPEYALYPLPVHASGARLQAILGLTLRQYLKEHDRVNLCTGEWNPRVAVEHAQTIHAGRADGTGVVLCGVKVAAAFRRAAAFTASEFTPLSLAEHNKIHYCVLPHPSGLNRMWNVPEVAEKARALYLQLRAVVGADA